MLDKLEELMKESKEFRMKKAGEEGRSPEKTETTSSFDRPQRFEFDVFLSFRGADTRFGFVNHLILALEEKGIKTFYDAEDLSKGEEIEEILEIIEASKMSIVIFSEDYASSSYCLDELVKILECKKIWGHKVLPVFYNVDPKVVAKQSGSYEEAFRKHENDRGTDSEEVRTWRASLAEAAAISGQHLQNERPETDHIQDIVKSVEKILENFDSEKGLSVGRKMKISRISSKSSPSSFLKYPCGSYLSIFFWFVILVLLGTLLAYITISPKIQELDVFLSVNGEEPSDEDLLVIGTQLHSALRQESIGAFMAFKEKGREVRKAIDVSRVAVIILSQGYASCRPCLEELVMIIEGRQGALGKTVIPILHNVSQQDLLQQNEKFAKGYVMHKENVKHLDKVYRWRYALRKAVNLPGGWEYSSYSSASEVISNVVQDIAAKLRTETESSSTATKGKVAKRWATVFLVLVFCALMAAIAVALQGLEGDLGVLVGEIYKVVRKSETVVVTDRAGTQLRNMVPSSLEDSSSSSFGILDRPPSPPADADSPPDETN